MMCRRNICTEHNDMFVSKYDVQSDKANACFHTVSYKITKTFKPSQNIEKLKYTKVQGYLQKR